MWTNVFRIGELQTVSWFQFLPLEPDPSTKDAANHMIISSHLQLQKEGILSTWTNSFVGPWDPSQGAHNPDEKIKLWLFIPGRNSSLSESAQSAVSKLRVVGNGIWIAPGDSEEISLALSQALRNSLESAMRRLNYVRFGDVFAKCTPSGNSERSLRRAQNTVEFVFAATDEAIYVHAIVSAKYVRSICGDDIEKILMHSSHSSSDGLPVIVAPNGMLGRLTGCCPSELVKQVYTSKIKSSASSAPYVNQSPGCQMRGQSFYVEIALGCSNNNNNVNNNDNNNNNMEKTFIYPPEAVLIPMMHRAFSRFSSKRFWIQNSTETSLSESWPFWNFSGSSFIEHCLAVGPTCHIESSRNSSCLRLKKHYGNNNNNTNNGNNNNISGSSSISSVSSSSSEDADADADSNPSKQNQGVKRGHGEITETTKLNNNNNMISNNHLMDASDSNRGALFQNGILTLEDDLSGFNVQALLCDFGLFGDFFENDLLDFGDPPGTAESQAIINQPLLDIGDITSTSPLNIIPQLDSPVVPLPVPSLPTLLPPVPPTPNIPPKPVNNLLTTPTTLSLTIPLSKQNVQLSKSEAMLTFATEYAAIGFADGLNLNPFRNPYRPKKLESFSGDGSYVYNANPPVLSGDLDDKGEATSKLYTMVKNHRNDEINKVNVSNNNGEKGGDNNDVEMSEIAGVTSLSSSNTKKKESSLLDPSNLIIPSKLSLATDVDCIMHQVTMCRTRHTLLSLKTKQQNQINNIKKENVNIPIRITDTDLTTTLTTSPQVGVWRSISPVSGQKPIKQNDEGVITNMPTRNPLMDFLVGLGLLVQNAASFVDLTLDNTDGEGPLSWVALQEQKSRGFVCEPDMAHAGCGGLLATCHSLDLAGVDLVNPLAADVSVPGVMSLLQTDIKQAIKSAFATSDGPLGLADWCKGRAHTGEGGPTNADPFSFLSDPASGAHMGGDSLSPPQSSSTSSSHREGQRRSNQESSNSEQDQEKGYSRSRPSITVLPTPSILVGYQDDWLKASVNSIQLWEKAPLEPYALPKPVSYYAICPDIELLTTAAVDFFQQLGTVYEICRLGTHSPGSQLDTSSSNSKPNSGLILLEAPQQVKTTKTYLTSVNSISDYFLSLSKNWTIKSFLNSLSKLLKTLKISPNCPPNQKEINNSSSNTTVVYVICPFPEPSSVLRTHVESSVALGTAVLTPLEKEKKYSLHKQVSQSLNTLEEHEILSNSNVTMLSGFNHPKLVLQVISIDSLLRLNTPTLNELSLLKDIAFTIYTKSRRVAKPLLDPVHQMASFINTRSTQMMMQHMTSAPAHMPGLWKDCLVPRALNARDTSSDFDPNYSSYQRNSNSISSDDRKYLFEPLFILSEPGSVDQNSSTVSDAGSDEWDPPSLHCCYGWTEDWKWFVCVWTDSRGELIDSYVFPFGGVSGRQDTKVLQGLFVQVLQQGCQIVMAGFGGDNVGPVRARDFVIARLGGFFELECQEWQKAIYTIGGNGVLKWPIQLRQGLNPNNANNPQDAHNMPSSASAGSLYGAKSSYMKTGAKKQITGAETNRGSGSALHLMQSVTLVGVSVEQSLRVIVQAESSQSGSTSTTQSTTTTTNYLEGFTPVKSLNTSSQSYLLIPSQNLKALSPSLLQLPTCLTSESPPLAHLLHSKGMAIPISTAYVASRSVQPIRRDLVEQVKEDWPSVLSISLVDYYGGSKKGRKGAEVADRVQEEVLESVGAELHGLSWLTVSPVYGERRTQLPFHCDMMLRLRRMLCYADRELERVSRGE